MQLRELHGDVPHAARAGMNQHRLPWMDSGAQMQRFPRGLADERQHGSGDVINRSRLARGASTIERNELRVGSVAEEIGRGEDFIARLPHLRARPAATTTPLDVVAEGDREIRDRRCADAPWCRRG